MIDPHLYHGVQCTFRAESYNERGFRFLRFWRPSSSPGRAWVIAWRRADSQPEPLLVELAALKVSDNGTDGPEMPSWAREFRDAVEIDRSWIDERERALESMLSGLERCSWSSFYARQDAELLRVLNELAPPEVRFVMLPGPLPRLYRREDST